MSHRVHSGVVALTRRFEQIIVLPVVVEYCLEHLNEAQFAHVVDLVTELTFSPDDRALLNIEIIPVGGADLHILTESSGILGTILFQLSFFVSEGSPGSVLIVDAYTDGTGLKLPRYLRERALWRKERYYDGHFSECLILKQESATSYDGGTR